MTNMETKFNFNTQVCSSIEQSRRLLALGLKKETADVTIHYEYGITTIFGIDYSKYVDLHKEQGYTEAFFENVFPAWSLSRLWELYWSNKIVSDCLFGCGKHMSPYAKMIALIEYDIEEGYFNKEYLV